MLCSIYNYMEQQLFIIVMEQQSYDRVYVIWITRIASTGPRIVCYWNTSGVEDRKLKIHSKERRRETKQCSLTNQAKKSKQKEEKEKNSNKIRDVKIMRK